MESNSRTNGRLALASAAMVPLSITLFVVLVGVGAPTVGLVVGLAAVFGAVSFADYYRRRIHHDPSGGVAASAGRRYTEEYSTAAGLPASRVLWLIRSLWVLPIGSLLGLWGWAILGAN